MRIPALLAGLGWPPLRLSGRSSGLALRQAELVERAAVQRIELAELHARIRASSIWLETGLAVLRSLRAHPQVVLLSLLGASMSFARNMSRARSWTIRGLALHQLYRVMGSSLLQMFRRKPEAVPAEH